LIAPPGSAALTQISPSLDIDEAPGTAGAYTVYPNPISGGAFQVIFQQLPKNNVHLEIFTDEGKLVYRNRYSAQQTLSVITPLSAGVYLLKINTGASFTVKKLICNLNLAINPHHTILRLFEERMILYAGTC
jgi:hypothetical protein